MARRSTALTQGLGQLRELVDVFAGVAAVGDAEAEVEVEALQEMLAEVVPLDHAEVVQRSASYRELNTGWVNRERERERQRDTERHRETQRERESERERQRHRETERERDRERETQRERETERQREREKSPQAKIVKWYNRVLCCCLSGQYKESY